MRIGRVMFMCCIVLLQSMMWVTPAYGLGVSPAGVIYKNLLEENTITAKLHVSRADRSRDETLKFSVRGDAAPYIRVPDEPVVIRQGEIKKVVPVEIRPEGAALGSYSGTIVIESMPTDKIDAMLSFVTAIGVDVNFTVTDEVNASFDIRHAYFPSVEGEAPPVLQLLIDNSGNIEWHPDEATLTLVPIDDLTVSSTDMFTQRLSGDQIPIVNPKAAKNISITFPESVPPGRYSASIEFTKDGEVIGEKSNVSYYVQNDLTPKNALMSGHSPVSPITILLMSLLAFVSLLLVVVVVVYYLLPYLKK